MTSHMKPITLQAWTTAVETRPRRRLQRLLPLILHKTDAAPVGIRAPYRTGEWLALSDSERIDHALAVFRAEVVDKLTRERVIVDDGDPALAARD